MIGDRQAFRVDQAANRIARRDDLRKAQALGRRIRGNDNRLPSRPSRRDVPLAMAYAPNGPIGSNVPRADARLLPAIRPAVSIAPPPNSPCKGRSRTDCKSPCKYVDGKKLKYCKSNKTTTTTRPASNRCSLRRKMDCVGTCEWANDGKGKSRCSKKRDFVVEELD